MVLDLVVVALAIAVFPLSVTAFVLVLAARRGLWKGLAFVLAWLACFVAVVAAVLLTTGGKPPAPRSAPSTASTAVKLAVGVVLVWYAVRRHRRGPRPRPAGGMMARLDRISLWEAAALGPLLQPWGLVAAGAATVVDADLSHASSFAALFGYCLLATSSLLAMEVYAAFAPDASRARLGKLRVWLQTHQDQALVVLLMGVGLFLVGRSLYQLTSG
ncbi:GAP family protein [Streptomyces sp. NPDC000658]|uniref:GAP family protein n=1 Tax=Streptomyces sp. NPDC000658 TaxID=3154266 RepID=UPI0033293F90